MVRSVYFPTNVSWGKCLLFYLQADPEPSEWIWLAKTERNSLCVYYLFVCIRTASAWQLVLVCLHSFNLTVCFLCQHGVESLTGTGKPDTQVPVCFSLVSVVGCPLQHLLHNVHCVSIMCHQPMCLTCDTSTGDDYDFAWFDKSSERTSVNLFI